MSSNEGFVRRGPPVAMDEPRTIVVVGVARGGTSMVSAVLDALGVFLGDEASAPRFEDARLVRAMRGESGEDVETIVADYDGRHRVWGFKYPPVAQEPELLDGVVRNPVYLAVFRDLLAVANRRQLAHGRDLAEDLRNTHEHYGHVVRFLADTERPSLLVSYEKALLDPHGFTRAIASVCGLSVSADDITRASQSVEASPIAYTATSTSARRLAGFLDGVSANGVRGWAVGDDHDDPCELLLLIDGVEIRRFRADGYRPDLVGRAHPKGICAFEVDDLPDGFFPKGSELRVVHSSDGTDLHGSPRRG